LRSSDEYKDRESRRGDQKKQSIGENLVSWLLDLGGLSMTLREKKGYKPRIEKSSSSRNARFSKDANAVYERLGRNKHIGREV